MKECMEAEEEVIMKMEVELMEYAMEVIKVDQAKHV